MKRNGRGRPEDVAPGGSAALPTEEGPALSEEEASTIAALAHAALPISPEGSLRDRLLAGLEPGRRFVGFEARMAEVTQLPVERCRELLEQADDPTGAGWTPGPASGIRLLRFEAGVGQTEAVLLFCEAGVVFPEHLHQGDERALLLEGSATDNATGDVWEVGDTLFAPAGSRHSFQTHEDGALLAVVVVETGIELTSVPT